MAPLTSFIENFCLKVYLKNWLRYRYSNFQFCLLPSAIDILATVTTLSIFKYLDISNVSCKFQRNRPSSFWDTALLSLYYLPKLHFGKYVTQSVCLYVCLFVTLLHHISRTNHQIITKLGPHMSLGTAKRPVVFGDDDVTNNVIRSKNRSNFEIAISQAIFKLQRRNKNWNAALIMGHYSVMVNFRCHLQLNTKFWHQNGGYFQNPCCVLDSLILTSDMKTT